eukprot:6194898-Pleurochrysis_carterae.AAC.2
MEGEPALSAHCCWLSGASKALDRGADAARHDHRRRLALEVEHLRFCDCEGRAPSKRGSAARVRRASLRWRDWPEAGLEYGQCVRA